MAVTTTKTQTEVHLCYHKKLDAMEKQKREGFNPTLNGRKKDQPWLSAMKCPEYLSPKTVGWDLPGKKKKYTNVTAKVDTRISGCKVKNNVVHMRPSWRPSRPVRDEAPKYKMEPILLAPKTKLKATISIPEEFYTKEEEENESIKSEEVGKVSVIVQEHVLASIIEEEVVAEEIAESQSIPVALDDIESLIIVTSERGERETSASFEQSGEASDDDETLQSQEVDEAVIAEEAPEKSEAIVQQYVPAPTVQEEAVAEETAENESAPVALDDIESLIIATSERGKPEASATIEQSGEASDDDEALQPQEVDEVIVAEEVPVIVQEAVLASIIEEEVVAEEIAESQSIPVALDDIESLIIVTGERGEPETSATVEQSGESSDDDEALQSHEVDEVVIAEEAPEKSEVIVQEDVPAPIIKEEVVAEETAENESAPVALDDIEIPIMAELDEPEKSATVEQQSGEADIKEEPAKEVSVVDSNTLRRRSPSRSRSFSPASRKKGGSRSGKKNGRKSRKY